MKGKAILWIILLLVAFLAGFIPQFMKAYRLSDELETARTDVAACRTEVELSEVRDLAALMYLETNRKNFGVAADHSKRFFDKVRDLASESTDPVLQLRLKEMLDQRDNITAGLASADPVVLAELQALLIKAHAVTGR